MECHLRSISELDVLLLLTRRPEERWDPASAARGARIDAEEAKEVLEHFTRQRLVRRVGRGYCFDPGDPELASSVRELAEVYPAFRVAVMSIIFSHRSRAHRPAF